MSVYRKARAVASLLTPSAISNICQPLDHTIPSTVIDPSRAQAVTSLLILCDFHIGTLIRVLGGNYISDFLHYSSIDRCLDALSSFPQSPDKPQHDFAQLHHLFHQHVPFKGSFCCSCAYMLTQKVYNNHRASDPFLPSILEKSTGDVQKSYSIALPRWTLFFLDGLFLAALGYATREVKGRIKGRQVNNPTALINGPNDSGALNSHISKKDRVAMPHVSYQTALRRL